MFGIWKENVEKKNVIFYNIWLVLYMIDELFVFKLNVFIEDVWYKNFMFVDKNWKLLYICFEL